MSHWDNELLSGIVGSLSMLVPGVVFLIRPNILIKWANSVRPQLDENSRSVKSTVRLIAAGLIFIGLLAALGIVDQVWR